MGGSNLKLRSIAGFKKRFGAILKRLRLGDMSRLKAAKELGIGYDILKHLLDALGNEYSEDTK